MSDSTHIDPFADREADNYENPIPSQREFIIEFLTQANVPMNRNDLFEALKLTGEDHYEGLRRRPSCHGTRWTTHLYSSSMLCITPEN